MFKKLSLSISIIITLIFCYVNAQRINKNNSLGKENFKEFFQKFEVNPTFQTSRIDFPLTLIKSDEDGNKKKQLIKKSQWKYTNMLKLRDAIITYKKMSADSMKVQYAIKDTGVSVDHVFCEKHGVWRLCLIVDNSD